MSQYKNNYHPSSQPRKMSIGVMADPQPKRNHNESVHENMSQYKNNYHPSSQPRKMSIGVMADPQPKRNPGPANVTAAKQSPQHCDDELISEMDKNGSTAVLKSKLLEILGKASVEHVNSETPPVVKTNSKLNQDKSSNNTESPPEVAIRRQRLVTRSLSKTGGNITEEINNTTTKKRQSRKADGILKERRHKSFEMRRPVTRSLSKRAKTGGNKVQFRENDGIRKETSKSKTPARSESTRTGNRSSLVEELAATPELFHGLSKDGDEQETPSEVLREKSAEPENDFQSPTFGYKAPIPSPSPCFSPEASPLHPRSISPAFGTKKTPQGTKSQASDKRLPDLKRDYSFRRESSAEPDEDFVIADPSSSEEDSEEPIDVSPALSNYNSPQVRETDNWRNENSKPGFSSAKRNSNIKGNERVVWKAGIHKTDFFQRLSEVDEGLGRAVLSFANALQNLKKKLKSAAKEKSSEIIASIVEKIHLELKTVKEKTCNVAEAKRKHAETRLKGCEGKDAAAAEDDFGRMFE